MAQCRFDPCPGRCESLGGIALGAKSRNGFRSPAWVAQLVEAPEMYSDSDYRSSLSKIADHLIDVTDQYIIGREFDPPPLNSMGGSSVAEQMVLKLKPVRLCRWQSDKQ